MTPIRLPPLSSSLPPQGPRHLLGTKLRLRGLVSVLGTQIPTRKKAGSRRDDGRLAACRSRRTSTPRCAPRVAVSARCPGPGMVCTPDFQGHLIYLAVVAQRGAARPRFSVHSSRDEAGLTVGRSITRQWTCGMESRLSFPLPLDEHVCRISTAPPPR